MKKSPYSLGHALAATCLVVFSAIPIAGAVAQTTAPARTASAPAQND